MLLFGRFFVIYRFLSFVFIAFFSFQSSLFAHGAGIIPLFDDGTALIGLGHRGWEDFGGHLDKGEKFKHGGWRECKEETGHYSFPNITLKDVKKSPYTQRDWRTFSYREYFVRVHGPKPSIESIKDNAALATQRLGAKAHVEKLDWCYVPAQDLLDAAQSQQQTLPGIKGKLAGPFFGTLKDRKTKTALQTFINSLQNPAPQQNTRDIVTTYNLSSHKKQVLYDNIVKNNIPGKVKPDAYHVTLGWIKGVNQNDYTALNTHLTAIANAHFFGTTFTADSVKPYTVNRSPLACPLVLVPQATEVAKFKTINLALFDGLQNYNALHGTNYRFYSDTHPIKFDPHVTLVNTSSIKQGNLNPAQIISTINPKIRGKSFEFLQPNVPAAPKPVVVAPKPVVVAPKPAAAKPAATKAAATKAAAAKAAATKAAATKAAATKAAAAKAAATKAAAAKAAAAKAAATKAAATKAAATKAAATKAAAAKAAAAKAAAAKAAATKAAATKAAAAKAAAAKAAATKAARRMPAPIKKPAARPKTTIKKQPVKVVRKRPATSLKKGRTSRRRR